jgi:hypothetical protein
VFDNSPLLKQSDFLNTNCFVDGEIPDIDQNCFDLLAKTMKPQSIIEIRRRPRGNLLGNFPYLNILLCVISKKKLP